jgi:hypothetical protein
MKFVNNIEVGSTPNFTLPLSDGTANQVLQTDGSGTVSWADLGGDANDYVTAAAFNTSTGVVTLTVQNQTNVTVNLDGRYLTAHPNITAATSVDNSGSDFIQDITLDSNGHVTGLVTATAPVGVNGTSIWFAGADSHTGSGVGITMIGSTSAVPELLFTGANGISTETNSNNGSITIDGSGVVGSYTWTVHDDTGSVAVTDGTHIQWSGTVSGSGTSASPYVFPAPHPTISAATSVNNSGRTYIQDITLDGNGHVTAITSATETVTNTDTTYSAGSGLDLSGTTFSLETDLRGEVLYTGTGNNYIYFDGVRDERIDFTVNSQVCFAMENDGSTIAFHSDGDIIAYSTTISDARLKRDVETIESASEKVSRLRGVEYTWDKGSRKDKREIGLIAQEVEEVIPEIVHEHTLPIFRGLDDSSTSYKTVDYEKIVALLIESNKEQQEIIAQLEERVIDLENRL